MSVLYSSENGFFISHAQFINACYCNVVDNSTEVKYKLRNELFKIDTPYKSDGNLLSKHRKRTFQQNNDVLFDKLQEEVSRL